MEKEESEKEVTDIEEDPEEESGEENVLKSTDKYNETCFHSLKYAYTNNKINSEQFEIIRKKILYPEPRIIHLINMSLLKKIYNIQVNIINDDEINVNDFVIWSCILDPKLFMEDM
jgi:hypothetical protein